MRIACSSPEDFFECLDAETKIFQSTIRVNVYRKPEGGKNRDAPKYNVVLQASAVIEVADGAEYILEFGAHCGVDYEDATMDLQGSLAAENLKERFRAYAIKREFKVLPGIVDY